MSAETNKQVRSLFGRKRDEPAQGPSDVETRLQTAEGRAEDAETRVGDLQAELMFYGDAIRSLKSELEAVTERVISRVAPQVVELEARNAETEAIRQSVTALQEDAESERAGLLAWRAQMDTLVSSLKRDIESARSHIDQMPERIRDALTPAAEAMATVGARMALLATLSMPQPVIPPAPQAYEPPEPRTHPAAEPAMGNGFGAVTERPVDPTPPDDDGSSFDRDYTTAASIEALTWND
jgi:hypothetical protein